MIDENIKKKKTNCTDTQFPFYTDPFPGDGVGVIPIYRIIAKLDNYYSNNDYVGAERYLKYWESEVDVGKDKGGLLAIYKEYMGLYSKLGKEEKAILATEKAMQLLKEIGLEGTMNEATILLNVATVYKAFNRANEALPIFDRARAVYEKKLPHGDKRIAGLYNNNALAFCDEKQYQKARELFEKAITILHGNGYSALEEAIIHLNIATLTESELGLGNALETIEECLIKAQKLLDGEDINRDGNYAYVCIKCAPIFDYYGWNSYANELKERAKTI